MERADVHLMTPTINKTGPTINKGNSKQDYQTPDDLMSAIKHRFGPIAFDLAADDQNKQAEKFFSIADDSLKQDWSVLEGNLWLNPPFAKIEPWATKCCMSAADMAIKGNNQTRIFFLVPGSVGSEWYRKWVDGSAYVLALNPRATFVGCKDPYPKDLILAVYGQGLTGFKTWRWK